jgi:hypothetical protein
MSRSQPGHKALHLAAELLVPCIEARGGLAGTFVCAKLRTFPSVLQAGSEAFPCGLRCEGARDGAASLLGLTAETVRLPLAPPGEATRARVRDAMTNAGLLN